MLMACASYQSILTVISIHKRLGGIFFIKFSRLYNFEQTMLRDEHGNMNYDLKI